MKGERRMKMKRVIATFLTLFLLALATIAVGCKTDSKQSGGAAVSNAQAMSLLLESSRAMSELNSYRMSMHMVMDAEGTEAESMGLPMTVDQQADIKITDGKMSAYLKMTSESGSIGTFETDSYIIGDVFYQYIEGQGWYKMNYGAYMTQNVNLGMLDSKQMEIMGQMAQNAEIIGEEGGKIGLSFHLNEDFFKAVLESASQSGEEGGQGLPQEWLQQAEGNMSGIESDVTFWLWQDSKLVDNMIVQTTLGNVLGLENFTQDMQIKMYDYNQSIEVVLPEEAKSAQEYTLPSS
jgi:Family of unknown function (DUF6612)